MFYKFSFNENNENFSSQKVLILAGDNVESIKKQSRDHTPDFCSGHNLIKNNKCYQFYVIFERKQKGQTIFLLPIYFSVIRYILKKKIAYLEQSKSFNFSR